MVGGIPRTGLECVPSQLILRRPVRPASGWRSNPTILSVLPPRSRTLAFRRSALLKALKRTAGGAFGGIAVSFWASILKVHPNAIKQAARSVWPVTGTCERVGRQHM